MEETKTNKLSISFIIDVPEQIDDSDFNSLVLRLQRLNDTRHSYTNNMDIEFHNRNIEEMQNLLENFKIKIFEEV